MTSVHAPTCSGAEAGGKLRPFCPRTLLGTLHGQLPSLGFPFLIDKILAGTPPTHPHSGDHGATGRGSSQEPQQDTESDSHKHFPGSVIRPCRDDAEAARRPGRAPALETRPPCMAHRWQLERTLQGQAAKDRRSTEAPEALSKLRTEPSRVSGCFCPLPDTATQGQPPPVGGTAPHRPSPPATARDHRDRRDRRDRPPSASSLHRHADRGSTAAQEPQDG